MQLIIILRIFNFNLMRGAILLIVLALKLTVTLNQLTHEDLVIIFNEIADELTEWVGYKTSVMEIANECKLDSVEPRLI